MQLHKITQPVLQLTLLIIVLEGIFSWAVTRTWTYHLLASTLDTPRKADAIIVLFDAFGEDHSLSGESIRRINWGVNLFKEGYAPYIIFTGGARPSHRLYGSKLMAEVAQGLGIPPDRIYYETNSNDTISNWKEGYKLVKAHRGQSALLVSSLFQLERMKFLINNYDIKVYYLSVPYELSHPPLSFLALWCDAHYNIASYLLYCLLPSAAYRSLINFLRH